MQVSELRLDEAVYVDAERLEEICHELGYSGGETAICAAMEDLAGLLHQAVAMWRANDVMALEVTARQINGVASRIGMVGLSRVAGDVMSLACHPTLQQWRRPWRGCGDWAKDRCWKYGIGRI